MFDFIIIIRKLLFNSRFLSNIFRIILFITYFPLLLFSAPPVTPSYLLLSSPPSISFLDPSFSFHLLWFPHPLFSVSVFIPHFTFSPTGLSSLRSLASSPPSKADDLTQRPSTRAEWQLYWLYLGVCANIHFFWMISITCSALSYCYSR